MERGGNDDALAEVLRWAQCLKFVETGERRARLCRAAAASVMVPITTIIFDAYGTFLDLNHRGFLRHLRKALVEDGKTLSVAGMRSQLTRSYEDDAAFLTDLCRAAGHQEPSADSIERCRTSPRLPLSTPAAQAAARRTCSVPFTSAAGCATRSPRRRRSLQRLCPF